MKNKIDIKKWKEFKISDLFDAKNTGNILARDIINGSGNTPYVTASGVNNGVVAHIDATKYEIIKGNCILVGGKTFTLTYQEKDFVSNDSHNFELRVKDYRIGMHEYLYLIAVLTSTLKNKFFWGDAVTKKKMLYEKILLPVDSADNPDWKYIKEYMKNIEDKSRKAIKKLNNCEEDTTPIDITEWKEFHLYDIFDIDSGSKMDRIAMKFDNPTINFVGRSGINNGVTAVVDEVKEYLPYKAGNLTLALGGAYLGSCFVQEKDFYTSQNVVVLIPKEDISFYAKEFICAVIFKEGNTHYKSFIDELNRHIKTDFVIKLPIDSYGKPNYEYMDKYMIKLLNKTKNKLNYLNNI